MTNTPKPALVALLQGDDESLRRELGDLYYVDPMVAPPARHKQTRIDSAMEAVTNTAIGFVLSLVTWHFVAWGFGIPMSFGMNLEITAIFTIVSIVRQYVLRRLFDGKSVWQAIRG